jgi:hypothetical protein
MTVKRWTSAGRKLGAVMLATAALTAVAPISGASASPNCSAVFGCSRSTNHSTSGFFARHNWTCSSGSTGTASTGCVGGDSFFVSTNYGTPSNQDWDVIQVDGGWCVKIHFTNWYGKSWNVTYNRLTSSTEYVKVEDGSVGDVRYQSSSSC